MHTVGNSAPSSQASRASTGTSLVVQWLKILLPMQGTQVLSLVKELRSYMSHGMAKLKKKKKKNPAANARNRGSVPGLRRFHMQRGNQADPPQLRSLHSRAHKSQLLNLRVTTTDAPSLKPVLLNRSHHSKSVHHN